MCFSRTLKFNRCQPALLQNLFLLRCCCHSINCFLSTPYDQIFWYLQQFSVKISNGLHTAIVQFKWIKFDFLLNINFWTGTHICTYIHRHKRGHIFLIIRPIRCTNFSSLFLDWNSTCFGQFLCPSSGVFHCTHNSVYRVLLLTRYQETCTTYTTAVCTVKNSWR
jgi:hypothetical protein